MKIRIIVIFLLAVAVSALADEPFIGTLRSTMGKPIKGAKVYVSNPKEAVKSDKKGEFKFDDIRPADSIHIDYKNRIHSFAVNGRQDIMFVVGEDNRIFERDNYTGETFHGHLVDYKSKPIRGAVVYAGDPFDYVKSDKDGYFLIDNIEPTDTLHIKYDGYIHDIAMDGSKGMYIKITRKPVSDNDETINIGAGNMRLKDYNGPYSKMDAKHLEATGETSIVNALKSMPGVSVSEDGIRIRDAIWEPLWVIDGIQGADPASVTVMEVESIIVLKDGATWGTRGAGGVILVTTKGSNL